MGSLRAEAAAPLRWKRVTSIRAGVPGGEEGVYYQARHAPRPESASLLFRLGAQTRAFCGGTFQFLLPQHPSPTPEKTPGLEAQPESPWDGGGGPAPHSLQKAGSVHAVQGKEGHVRVSGLSLSPGGAGQKLLSLEELFFKERTPFGVGGVSSCSSPHSALLKAQTRAEHRVPTGGPLCQPRHQQPHRR